MSINNWCDCGVCKEELLAVAVLPYLLPDVRSSADSEKVLYFTNVSYECSVASVSYSGTYVQISVCVHVCSVKYTRLQCVCTYYGTSSLGMQLDMS